MISNFGAGTTVRLGGARRAPNCYPLHRFRRASRTGAMGRTPAVGGWN